MGLKRLTSAAMSFAALYCIVTPALAQQTTAAYAVVELDVRQPEEFSKEFFPLAAKVFADAGASFVVKPSPPAAIDDDAPKRVAIIRYDSVEKAKATFASEAYREARKIGDKYASFRIFVVTGVAP